MAKPRNPYRFTRKETIERLQAAKSYFGNKERLAFMRTQSIYVPAGYRPKDDESYYAAPRLSAFDVQCLADSAEMYWDYNWKADDRFKAVDSTEFTGQSLGNGASIGASIVVIFYPWKDESKVSKAVALWLGTWHHAPIAVCSDGSSIKIDSLPQYIDLIH
jgi:hypothetical protein